LWRTTRLSFRRRQGVDRQAAHGKRVVVDERIVGKRRRALLPIPTARSTGWAITRRIRLISTTSRYRPAQQDVFEPDFGRFHSIDGSDLRRAAGGIWRQDQRRDCCDHPLGPGRNHAPRQLDHFLRIVRVVDVSADVLMGQELGNFITVGGLNSGRFLDAPEFAVMHDKGNAENLFDRVDFQLSSADSIHLNFSYSRSWFQTPNSFDAQSATPWSGLGGIEPQMAIYGGVAPNGDTVGPTDQRSKIGPLTSRHRGRVWSATILCLLWAVLCAATTTTITRATILSRTLGRPVCSGSPWGRTERWRTRGFDPTFPMSGGSIISRPGPHTSRRFLMRTTGSGLSIRPTMRPASSFPVASGLRLPTYPSTCPSNTGTYQANQPGTVTVPSNAPGSSLYPFFNPILAPYDLTRGGVAYTFNATRT